MPTIDNANNSTMNGINSNYSPSSSSNLISIDDIFETIPTSTTITHT